VREACTASEVQLGIVSLSPLEVGNQATISTTTTIFASTTTSIVSPSSTSTSSVPGTSTTTTSLANRWIDHGDGTVSDLITGLMWEKLSNDGSIHDQDTGYFYGQAIEKIDLLNATLYAGYSDWRFPSRVELETILDLTVVPSVPSAFNQACTFACTVL